MFLLLVFFFFSSSAMKQYAFWLRIKWSSCENAAKNHANAYREFKKQAYDCWNHHHTNECIVTYKRHVNYSPHNWFIEWTFQNGQRKSSNNQNQMCVTLSFTRFVCLSVHKHVISSSKECTRTWFVTNLRALAAAKIVFCSTNIRNRCEHFMSSGKSVPSSK